MLIARYTQNAWGMVIEMSNTSYQVSLPDCIWEMMEEHMKTDCLIKSRSDALISLLRNAYPELKEKLNIEAQKSNRSKGVQRSWMRRREQNETNRIHIEA